MNEQQLIGSMLAVLGGVGWYQQRWLLEQTSKGRRLTGWFGPRGGRWALRALLAGVAAFGILLASNVIGPMEG